MTQKLEKNIDDVSRDRYRPGSLYFALMRAVVGGETDHEFHALKAQGIKVPAIEVVDSVYNEMVMVEEGKTYLMEELVMALSCMPEAAFKAMKRMGGEKGALIYKALQEWRRDQGLDE